MVAIAYQVDIYGGDARVSAAADYVELIALTGRRLTLADLADFFSDTVTLLRRDKYVVGLELASNSDDSGDDAASDDQEPGREAARRVMSLLSQRARLLAENYPFVVSEAAVQVARRRRLETDPYVALLATATAHAYHLETGSSVTDLFEESVARAVRKRIPRTCGFGAARRRHGGFVNALKAEGPSLMLPTTTRGVVLSTSIKDGGADTLAHLDWGDQRVGRWAFVGQVTCAQSDYWEEKANEARRGTWRGLLGDELDPIPFLAVPHHVEDVVLLRLAQQVRSVVLDRLRLARHLRPLVDGERVLIQKVLQTEVEYL